jgi:hypothetical protein
MYADSANYTPHSVPPDWYGAVPLSSPVQARAAAQAPPCLITRRRPGWLHCIVDVPPSAARAAAVYVHPVYELPWDEGKLSEEKPISSYDPAVYMPKGYAKHPGGRADFSVVRRWQPPGGPPVPR